MSETFYTSDSHFGHRNIIHLGSGRPFATIEEHDEALIENWNRVVGIDDTVYHLGDFSLSAKAMEDVTPRLNGRKILVAGNHDVCWTNRSSGSSIRKARKTIQRFLAAGFDAVFDHGQAYVRLAGMPVMLSHLPAEGDHYTEERYPERRPHPGDLPLVCGHVHQAWREHGRQVNVGVDQWNFTPVHEDEVAAVINSW